MLKWCSQPHLSPKDVVFVVHSQTIGLRRRAPTIECLYERGHTQLPALPDHMMHESASHRISMAGAEQGGSKHAFGGRELAASLRSLAQDKCFLSWCLFSYVLNTLGLPIVTVSYNSIGGMMRFRDNTQTIPRDPNSPGLQVIAAGKWRCATSSLQLAFQAILDPPLAPSMHGAVSILRHRNPTMNTDDVSST